MTSPSRATRRPWVVGHDGSECADVALRWALAQAPDRTDQVRVVSTWLVPVSATAPQLVTAVSDLDRHGFEAATRSSVERSVADLPRHDGIAVETRVREGHPSSVLLGEAADADLLVVGSRGLGGFARLVMGSTSTQCATHATTATAVVPTGTHPTRVERIVVAVDGSANSLAAARWALDFATTGTTVEFVGVWDVSPIAVGADQFFFPDASELAEHRFEHHIDEATDRMHSNQSVITVRRRFVEGRTRPELLDASQEADLLVLGARGHGAVGAALLGSVSTWLLHHAVGPIVVVPDTGDVTPEAD